jgi:L-rhamnose-H+ transport protein
MGVAVMFAPGMISGVLRSEPAVFLGVCSIGMLWGVGAVLFGLSLRRLGIAITNALVLGIVVLVGTLGPLVVGLAQIDREHLFRVICALIILVASLLVCALASLARDSSIGEMLATSGWSARSLGAVLIAVLSGVLSSMINIGFAFGLQLVKKVASIGYQQAVAPLAVWFPILLGGLIINAGYCLYLIWQGSSWMVFVGTPEAIASSLRSFLMGALWFSAIMLYGYGASVIGGSGPVYGFALVNSSSILIANIWSAAMGEWVGAGRKPKGLMWLSTALLISSFYILAHKR